MSTQIIKVPDIGGAKDVDVIEVCVSVGDQIVEEQSLIVLETEKASMEIPSSASGKVVSISLKEGDKVAEGDVILEIELSNAENSKETAANNHPSQDKSDAGGNAPASAEPMQKSTTDKKLERSAPVETPLPVIVGVATQRRIVTVPDIGGAENVDVIEVCVSQGDGVNEGDSLIVLESDKASMDIPAPFGGVVESISVAVGDKVAAGSVILELDVQAPKEETVDLSAARKTVADVVAGPVTIGSIPTGYRVGENEIPQEKVVKALNAAMAGLPSSKANQNISLYGDAAGSAVSKDARQTEAVTPSRPVYAGPAVRATAREYGVDLALVTPTGPRGRLLKEDVQIFVKTQLSRKPGVSTAMSGSGIPPIPEIDFAKFGEIELVAMSKVHRITASNMLRSWLNVPHVTQFDEADITDLESFRQSLKAEAATRGVKLSPLPFILKAVVATLKAQPKFNISLHADGEHIVQKHYYHIGIAVDTPVGLMVPVVKDADKKSLWELSQEISALSQKARDGKLKPNEMQGGCFTISSLGAIGGQGFTPIVNAPEVGILGVSKSSIKPYYDGSAFVPRQFLPLSLSYDHRAVNGADAGKFLTHIVELLTDIRRLVL